MGADGPTEAQQRIFKLRNDFQKQTQNPYRHMKGEGGFVFDPNFQRYHSMRVSHYDHFKPTIKTTRWALGLVILPIAGLTWLMKWERDGKEHLYRTGQVSYADRKFKFI